MTTGECIKAARKNAKMTQAALGKELGVSASMIAQYENGARKPKYETLKRIADAINKATENMRKDSGEPEIFWFELSPDSLVEYPNEFLAAYVKAQAMKALDVTIEYGKRKYPGKDYSQIEHSEASAKYMETLLSRQADVEAYVWNMGSKNIEIGVPGVLTEADLLMETFSRLNDDGKRVALERVQELAEIPKYQSARKEKSPQE